MKKGFTLIELLAVITILGITIAIIMIKVEKPIIDASTLKNQQEIDTVESAALVYVEDNIDSLSNLKSKNVEVISISNLVSYGLINSNDLSQISTSQYVLVANINNNYRSKYIGSSSSNYAIFLIGSKRESILQGTEYEEKGAYLANSNSITSLSSNYIHYEDMEENNLSNPPSTTSFKAIYSYNNAYEERQIDIVTE